MLRRERGKIVFECDDCGEIMDSGTADFADALEELRKEGWRPVQREGVWEHMCSDCQSEDN